VRGESVGGVGWEEDIPELGRGRGEFDGDEGALGVHDGGTDDVSLDPFLGLGIFDGKFCAGGQALGENDHRSAGADSVRGAVDGIGFALDVHEDGHPEKYTLSAAALLIGLRARGGGAALDVRGSGTSSGCGRRGFL